nr:hypothetical protein BaRGS_022430 [Batillaria attramentaria]
MWTESLCGKDSDDVKNVTLQFPVMPVPARETTYMCAVFEFPEPESDVHMIATSPLLDNRQACFSENTQPNGFKFGNIGSLIVCDPSTYKGCDLDNFWAEIGPFWYAVTTNCAYHTCYPECKETILAEQRRNPCLANRDWVSFNKKWILPRVKGGMEFLAKFVSCDVELYGASNVGDSNTTGAVPTGSGSTSTGAVTSSFARFSDPQDTLQL